MGWPFDDPPAFSGTRQQALEKFRQVRDQIEARIVTWLQELDTDPARSDARRAEIGG
jgi:arsenate reductase